MGINGKFIPRLDGLYTRVQELTFTTHWELTMRFDNNEFLIFAIQYLTTTYDFFLAEGCKGKNYMLS